MTSTSGGGLLSGGNGINRYLVFPATDVTWVGPQSDLKLWWWGSVREPSRSGHLWVAALLHLASR